MTSYHSFRMYRRHILRLLSSAALFALGVGLLLIGAAPARAITVTVTTTVDEDDGTTDPTVGSGTSLREAIRATNITQGTNRIKFATGLTGTISLTGTLPAIHNDLTLAGPGAQTLAVNVVFQLTNTGSNRNTAFMVSPGVTVSISGLTIQSAYSYADDYGLVINQGNLTLADCLISGGYANTEGGGISNTGQMNVLRCTLYGNDAVRRGGGIVNRGSLLLSNSTLYRNTVVGATGMDLSGVFGVGGGVYNVGSLTIAYCTFMGNFSQAGSGVNGSDPYGWDIITNAGGNTGSGGGGSGSGGRNDGTGSAVYSDGGRITVSNSIFTNNALLSNPGGSSFASRNGAVRVSGGHNISNDLSGPNSLTDRRATDPNLDPKGLQLNGGQVPTVALLYTSPAIDAGDPATAPVTDQRGALRPTGAGPDIGAFEFVPSLHVILTDISPSRVTAGVVNMTFVITNAGNVPMQNITVLSARLGKLAPFSINDQITLLPGATRGITMSFNNGNAGIPSGYTPFILNGSYTGGTFNIGVNVYIPPVQ